MSGGGSGGAGIGIFLLASFGLTILMTKSWLVAWAVGRIGLARWPLVAKGMRCAQCMGFWVGAWLGGSGIATPLVTSSFGNAVLYGLASSGLSWFLTTLANPYQEIPHDD